MTLSEEDLALVVAGLLEINQWGDLFYYDDEKYLHRDNGPAFISSTGFQAWYQHGELHREGGPAVVRASGTVEWYIRGKRDGAA